MKKYLSAIIGAALVWGAIAGAQVITNPAPVAVSGVMGQLYLTQMTMTPTMINATLIPYNGTTALAAPLTRVNAVLSKDASAQGIVALAFAEVRAQAILSKVLPSGATNEVILLSCSGPDPAKGTPMVVLFKSSNNHPIIFRVADIYAVAATNQSFAAKFTQIASWIQSHVR